MELLKKSLIILALSLFASPIYCKVDPKCSWTLKDIIDFQHIVTNKFGDFGNLKNEARNCDALTGSTALASDKLYTFAHVELHLSIIVKHQKRYRAYLASRFKAEGLLSNKTFDYYTKTYEKVERKIEDQTALLVMEDYYDYWTKHNLYSGDDEETRCSSKDYVQIFRDLQTELEFYGRRIECQPWVKLQILVARHDEENEIKKVLSNKILQSFKKLLEHRVKRNNTAFTETADALLANLTTRLEVEILKLKDLEKVLPAKGIAAVVAVINRGKHFDQARVMLDEVLRFNADAYDEVLKKSYGCDLKKLLNTFKFAKSYNRRGLNVILNDMEKCGHKDTATYCAIKSQLEGQENLDVLLK